jgi:serine/threonine-protein kinase
MGAVDSAKKCLEALDRKSLAQETLKVLNFIDITFVAYSPDTFTSAVHALLSEMHNILDEEEERCLLFLFRQAIRFHRTEQIYFMYTTLLENDCILSVETKKGIDSYRIWALLLDKKWEQVEALLNTYPLEELLYESSILFFLYGCWLFVSEGQDIAAAHFSGSVEITHPRTWTLFNHFYNGRIDLESGWILKAFSWEKRQLYLQLSLFYECLGDSTRSQHFQDLERNESL